MVPQDVQTARLTNIAPLCDPGHMGMKRGSGATSLGVTELAGFAARAGFPRSPSPPIPAVSERQASQWNAARYGVLTISQVCSGFTADKHMWDNRQ